MNNKKQKKHPLLLLETALEVITFNVYTLTVLIITFMSYFGYLRIINEIDLDDAISFAYLYSLVTVLIGIKILSIGAVVIYKYYENKE